MRKLFVLLLLTVFAFTSCDKGEQFNMRPENITPITEEISIENGVLRFKTIDAYNDVLEKIKKDSKEFEKFRKILLSNGFEPLEMVYANLDEKTVQKILETQVVPDNLKAYLQITAINDKEFELNETIQSSWLKLILNKNLNFSIGDGLLTIQGGEITLVDNYKRATSSKYTYKIENSMEDSKKARTSSVSNDVSYEASGNIYRLKININTPGRAYLAQWGFNIFFGVTEVELRHQRRTLWTWWQFDTSELSLETHTNGWGPNRQNPSLPYGWYDYFDTTGIRYNASRITQYGPDIRWINSTGIVKCIDGVTRIVSAGESA